jgi:hypothetical protein
MALRTPRRSGDRNTVAKVAVMVLFVAVLAACGGSDTERPTENPAPSTTSARTSAPPAPVTEALSNEWATTLFHDAFSAMAEDSGVDACFSYAGPPTGPADIDRTQCDYPWHSNEDEHDVFQNVDAVEEYVKSPVTVGGILAVGISANPFGIGANTNASGDNIGLPPDANGHSPYTAVEVYGHESLAVPSYATAPLERMTRDPDQAQTLIVIDEFVQRIDDDFYEGGFDRYVVATMVYVIDVATETMTHVELIGLDAPGATTNTRWGSPLVEDAWSYINSLVG